MKDIFSTLAGFLLAGLAIGALRPTNTWDFYPYLALGVVAVSYTLWKNFRPLKWTDQGPAFPSEIHPLLFTLLVGFGGAAILGGLAYIGKSLLSFSLNLVADTLTQSSLHPLVPWFALALGAAIPTGYRLWPDITDKQQTPLILRLLAKINPTGMRVLYTLGGVILLAGFSLLLFQPYAHWYALGYSKVDIWKGTHTPPSAYFYHWGLFLFLIITWMLWETREWMAATPLSSLRKLTPYRYLILAGLLLLLLSILGSFEFLQVRIAWIILPLATWAGILLLRPGLPEAKRIVLFLIGTALTLTLMVEIIVLVGDIGRMNTVFKFYLQAWTLFAISAATAFGWLVQEISHWIPGWRRLWLFVLVILVFGAALYPLTATRAKIEDRMAPDAPHTLDGMAFMPYSTYRDEWGVMDLGKDYRAIRWLQENVMNSPVIVEANLRALYRWGSRMTIYTGLPGVVGWEWHQQQQRAILPGSWVSNRIKEVDDFYLTSDLNEAKDFLLKYDVQYIILGQQERGKYPGPGLDKFPAAEGVLWREVYRDGETVIYHVVITEES